MNRKTQAKIHESEKLNGCPALMLAVDGWAEIMHCGLASDCVTLEWNQSVIWIEVDGAPVSVVVWCYQEYRREIWISLSSARFMLTCMKWLSGRKPSGLRAACAPETM